MKVQMDTGSQGHSSKTANNVNRLISSAAAAPPTKKYLIICILFEVVSQNAVNRPESISPSNFFSFTIGSPVIGDANFIDSAI